MTSIPIVVSDEVPAGRAYLIPPASFAAEPPRLRVYEDLWGQNPRVSTYDLERRRALLALERIVDEAWRHYDLDPETWRRERANEMRASNRAAFIAEARMALTVNPRATAVITGV